MAHGPRSLVVWGGWPGHAPESCAHRVRDFLTEDGFAVDLSDSPAVLGDPAIVRYDLVVPIVSMGTLSREQGRALSEVVRSGVGLGGFHGGMCDAFRDCVEYQFICGGQWVAHPGGIVDYRVNVRRPEDPVMRDIGDFDYRSEQYYMHVDPANEVLATTTFSGEHAAWIEGVEMPVVWKRRHGAGWVFYSALGHAPEEFDCREMRTILRRGLAWAARRWGEAGGGGPTTA